MIKHLLNVVKDAFDPRDHSVAPNRADSAVKVSFRDKVPYIKDQGQAGSCTGHAGSEFFELLYRMQWPTLNKISPSMWPNMDLDNLRFSPMFLYGQERIKEGTFLKDAGADSRTIFKVLREIGCCLESEDPYNDQQVFALPSREDIESAAKYKIGAYHRIWDMETAKTVLKSGYSFTIGIPVFDQLESDECLVHGLVRVPKKTDTPIGGHEMHVIGYDSSKEVYGEVGAFEVANSWGDRWGDHGYAWIPDRYFKAAPEWDAWVGHFGGPWTPKTK